MTPIETQSLIAWWGAGLSTLLAIVKISELWRDRFRLEVSYDFNGLQSIGNNILVRNLSSRPVILSWWEVMYVSGRWPSSKSQEIACPEPGAGDLRIDPHSTLVLNFSGQHYFSWGNKALDGRRIYIRLHAAGRKPIVKLVYPS